MSDDNANTVDDTNELDAFEQDFFQTAPAEDEVIEDEAPEDEDHEDNPLDTEADEEAEVEDEESEAEDEDEEEEEPDEVPEPPKRKSAKERINELTAKAREAERREQALLKRLEALEASEKEVKAEDKPPLRDVLPDGAPQPDATGEDGEALYPLGEFDPLYIRDLTRFTIKAENEAIRETRQQEELAAKMEAEKKEIQETWVSRLDAIEEEIPDIRDGISDLTDTFAELEPNYGEYLATLLMSSEQGPRIMHYLSQNLSEAQKIVASGPAAATLALGRLEARFITTRVKEETKRNVKKSSAPTPPETSSKGRGSKFDTKDDTEDLDAFERKFFSK